MYYPPALLLSSWEGVYKRVGRQTDSVLSCLLVLYVELTRGIYLYGLCFSVNFWQF